MDELDSPTTLRQRVFVEKAQTATRNVFADNDRREFIERQAIGVVRRQSKQDGNRDPVVAAPFAFDGRVKSSDKRFDLDSEICTVGNCASRHLGVESRGG